VFRFLNRSTDRTFFIAVQLLDRFFSSKQSAGITLDKKDLHLFGLVSSFIASKIEDRRCIRMNEVLKEAGHGKFTKLEIIGAEKELCQTLGCELIVPNLLDEVIIALRTIIQPAEPTDEPPSLKTNLELVCTFAAKAFVHDVKLTALPLASQVYTVISVAIDFFKELLSLRSFRPDFEPATDVPLTFE